MEPSFPRGLGPAHFDPATIRAALNDFAHILGMIKTEWLSVDRERLRLVEDGFEPHTGGYEQIVREDLYDGIVDLYEKELKSDLLPFVLPHVDALLRERIARVMGLLDLDSTQVDSDGNETERWRQFWGGTGLQAELDTLCPMLRAAGDKVAIDGAGGLRPSPDQESIASEVPEPPKSSAPATKAPSDSKEDVARKKARALQLRAENPDWSTARIAKAVGLSGATLSRYEAYQTVQKMVTNEPKRGVVNRGKDGSIHVESVGDSAYDEGPESTKADEYENDSGWGGED